MRAMICVALLLGAFVVKCHFDAAAERARREHLRFGAVPASPFSAHWYLDAERRMQLRPGHRDPYEEDGGGGGAVATTMRAGPPYAGARAAVRSGAPGQKADD